MLTFRNPIVAGTTMVVPAIQSPNFVTGVSGWRWGIDGSLEANNAVIRGGTVISGTSLYYNGPPALGNLIESHSAAAGTDSYGNAYLQGSVTYFTSGGTFYAQQSLGYNVVYYTAPAAGGPYTTFATAGRAAGQNYYEIRAKSGVFLSDIGESHRSVTYMPSGDGTGATDGSEINAWLNAGYHVFLVTGDYFTSQPLVVKSGGLLRGFRGKIADSGGYGTRIRATGIFAQGGAPAFGVVVLGDGTSGSEMEVSHLSIDASQKGDPVPTGIMSGGQAGNVLLQDLFIYNCHTGVDATNAAPTWRAERVTAGDCYAYGFFGMQSDSDYIDCIAGFCTLDGFYFNNPINSRLIGCRAEWNGQFGYHVLGDNTATGGAAMMDCSTDRNAQHGIFVEGTGNWPLLISGAQLRRDGASSTTSGYAGLAVAHTCTMPVIVDGITTFPGFNDDGSGNQSPQYGINVNVGGAGAPTYVQVANAFLHAISAGVNGTLTSNRAVALRTGSWNAPGAITQLADSA